MVSPEPHRLSGQQLATWMLVALICLVSVVRGIAVFTSRGSWTPAPPGFPLRADSPPTGWAADQINEGVPYHWEKGVVQVLAWEVGQHDWPWQ
jgi:hypothetical protein